MSARYKHQMERRLKESEQRYIAALRCLAAAVVATDMVGRITFLNPAAEKLSGWPADKALGRPAEAVFNIYDEQTCLPLRGFAETTDAWINRLSPRAYLVDRNPRSVEWNPGGDICAGDENVPGATGIRRDSRPWFR